MPTYKSSGVADDRKETRSRSRRSRAVFFCKELESSRGLSTGKEGRQDPMELGRMNGASARTIACALVVVVVAGRVAGEYDGRESDMVEGPRVERMYPETSGGCSGGKCLAQNSEGPVGAIWFGPRLGRRRRSDLKLTGNGEVLASPVWNAVSSSGNVDKRQNQPFTPRLGRELENAISLYDLMRELRSRVEEPADIEQDQQDPPPLFPPRLGRTLGNPRLEHELRNLLRKFQVPY